MVNLLLELLFVGGLLLSLAASAAVIFFLKLFDRVFDEETYGQGFLAFRVFLIAIFLHLLYYVARDYMGSSLLEGSFELVSFAAFIIGVAIITGIVLHSEISYETHRQLQRELNTKTEALTLYAADLKYSNRLKDLFTDIMSHDLLNPIGIILNYAELMIEDESEMKRDRIEAIKRNAARAVEMIESAAIFSRLQRTGGMDLATIDLGEVVKAEIGHMEPHAAEKGITLTGDITGKYPVAAAPVVKEVFSNLLSNAIKYSPRDSEVQISIDDAGRSWRVAVRDRGEGIDDQYKESIFNRFERREKKGVKGTGLGLAIVKRIVELHEGRVWVEDNPGGGSVFIVELPKRG
ncbi:MAG: sensor histidine kinase, partial [Methanobacteriota archaeon]